MANDTPITDESTAPEVGLDSGTYEIIRNRLRAAGSELKSRLDVLNAARKDAFGSIETALLTTERITTSHNCISRDMVAVGDHVLFGYNIHFGLKAETDVTDVFSQFRFADHSFHAPTHDLIDNAEFQQHFRDLFRYYKETTFAKFAIRGPHLFMVFKIGRGDRDIKTFKWLIDGDSLKYLGNRSDHEYDYPSQHEFEWVRATRDQHIGGLHPHITIDDRVFVETVGGDLTIKVENNTESGAGIYEEPVDNADQTLDDAEVHYALLGHLILLKIRPYQEKADRYFVFNEKLQEARRLDSMADACILLPDDHGLIFSNGYYLQTGECKTFEVDATDMLFERRIEAPNGEDFLYLFYSRATGEYVVLQYNLIEQKLQTPLVCAGWTFFGAGELACFKSHTEPQKHHAIQLWQTPYVGENYVPPVTDETFVSKIGNKELVRGMAECHEVLNLIQKDDSYAGLYTDLVKLSGAVSDSYFWMDREETGNLAETLHQIRDAANAAVGEYEKVVRVRRETMHRTREVTASTKTLLGRLKNQRFENIQHLVDGLGNLRTARGEVISLRDLRYVDGKHVDSLEEQVIESSERLSRRAVERLLEPSSLDGYRDAIEEAQEKIAALEKVTEAEALGEAIGKSATELEMLIEIVSNLKIDDATQRTTIIENISAIFATINQSRAALKNKTRELASVEGIAEFQSQITLLNQSVANYLDLCESPEKCDEYLTKLIVTIEELDGRFAEFDEFVLQLTEKREEIYNAFESRKLALVETRNKRANALVSAAERVLKGIGSRVEQFKTIEEINAYFAADLMIEKVRDIIDQLGKLGDSVKVDDIQSRLKTVREDAVRQLTDRSELYVDGENAIRFGSYTFNVNTQPLALTTVVRDDTMCLHLTGTNFYEPIEDERLNATREVWDQSVISETRDVYRGEYLAYKLVTSWDATGDELADTFVSKAEPQQIHAVQAFMSSRYSEAYTKGVHDHDATKLATRFLTLRSEVSDLQFSPTARTAAELYWRETADTKPSKSLAQRLASVGKIERAFRRVTGKDRYLAELESLLNVFYETNRATAVSAVPSDNTSVLAHGSQNHGTYAQLFASNIFPEAAEALYGVLTDRGAFRHSQPAADLLDAFTKHLKSKKQYAAFDKSMKDARNERKTAFTLAREWLRAFLADMPDGGSVAHIDEAAILALGTDGKNRNLAEVSIAGEIDGMLGSHRLINSSTYHFDLNDFTTRLRQHATLSVPRFEQYTELKHNIVEEAREDMRLDEFKPRVLTSFVRNRLLDEVYLPMIGANLAKQIGVSGEGKRTDLMGLLLLVSPPGYGKTTLMEYIASRLGLIFMKINGPALGHSVTSLDPVEAPNAGSREEIEKLNLALEMGDNVLIYLDDIQHTNPEFLQKFISLCDGQRKIEGVYKGRTRTYDLRGRKVAVVMAGNPYTESGEKFQIPDMLANRADIYNLGEIIGESAEAFEMSYLENSITSNPTLSKLASRGQADIRAIIAMAEDKPRETIEFKGNESPEEINDYVAVMKKLIRVRNAILAVNQEYIRSAAQSDDYRTEPPFKLQGSYRNMNRIAERVVPVMNDDELTSLIVTNYENDAQTLTSGAEVNLLKVRQIIGVSTDADTERWNKIIRTFQENARLKGVSADDKAGQVIARIGTLSDNLDGIREAMSGGLVGLAEQLGQQTANSSIDEVTAGVAQLQASLAAINNTLAQAAAQQATSSLDDNRITVVNRVPSTITAVLKSQFSLMQAWMEPLHHTAKENDAELQKLHEKLDDCLQAYEKLVDRVEGAKTATREGEAPAEPR